MTKLCAYLGIAAVATISGAALARPVGDINSLQTAPYWYADYFGNSQLTINGVDRSNGASSTEPMNSLRITDVLGPGGNFTDRHHAAVAVNGNPYLFQPGAEDFRIDVDVTILTPAPINPGDPRVEAGIWFGTAGNFPSSLGADVGNFVLLPSNGGEIAAFGGTMPFFSNNQPQYAGMARAFYQVTYHMSMNYYTAGEVIVYGVNGVYTQALGISHNGNPGFAPNSMLGVYVQGPNGGGGAGRIVDVLFENVTVTVPAPGAAALLGLAGLVATRRRR